MAPPAANALFIDPPILEAHLKQCPCYDNDVETPSHRDIIMQIGRILGNWKSPYFPKGRVRLGALVKLHYSKTDQNISWDSFDYVAFHESVFVLSLH